MNFRNIKYWPWIFAFGLCSWALIYSVLFYDISFNDADTPNFVGATQLLFGDDTGVDTQSRITKPAVLILPGLLHYLAETPIIWGMRLQNLGFFVGLGFLIIALLKQLGFREKEQLMGLFLYLTIQTFAYTSTMLISDIAGHFFAFLALYYYFKNAYQWQFEKSIYLALIILAGLLSKESAGIAIIPIGLHAFFNLSKKQYTWVFLAFLIALADTLITQLFIRYYFETNDMVSNWLEEFQNNNGLTGSFAQIIHAFDLYWIFILLGFYTLWKGRKAPFFKAWWWSGLVVLPLMFLWPTVQDRTVFALGPIFLIIMLYGLRTLRSEWMKSYLPLIFGGLQVLVVYLIYQFKLPHLLPSLYGLGTMLILAVWGCSRQKTVY